MLTRRLLQLLPRPTRAAACAAAACALAGCASNNGSDGVLTGTASAPNIPTVSSPSTPGPNDPLTQFERRRLISRIQQDPQHHLQRLSARERRDLAAIAQASKKSKKDDE